MSRSIKSPALSKILSQQGGALAVDDGDTVHFLVTQSKGKNYLEHCNKIRFPEDPIATLLQYTEHTNELYAKINLSLASDSTALNEHGTYIAELRSSVLAMPLLDDSVLYRGVDLSDIEIREMERLGRFFIPSFTSTSTDPDKVYEKDSVLRIKTAYLSRNACSITENLSKYHSTEKEVLIACYSAFQLERVELVGKKNIITLFLDEFGSSCDRL